MKELLVHLDDLPDEILIQIFKKLHNMEVLYYLIDVNQRLNRIVHDPAFTSNLCLLTYCPYKNITCPLPDIVLDRFFAILPKIGHRIRTLCLEGRSMERILQATNYPNLYGLALYHVDVEVARTLFSGKKFSSIDPIIELFIYFKIKMSYIGYVIIVKSDIHNLTLSIIR